jgi:hypothetical protein
MLAFQMCRGQTQGLGLRVKDLGLSFIETLTGQTLGGM